MIKLLGCIVVLLLVVRSTKAINTVELTTNSMLLEDSLMKKTAVDTSVKNQWIIYESTTAIATKIGAFDTIPQKNTSNKKQGKKTIAALLAFPVPFGIVGLHRIYLGTKPYVPLVYIATLGGAAGIVPLIDFIFILLEKDIGKYEDNPNIIMWAN